MASLFPPTPPVLAVTEGVRAALAANWPRLNLTLASDGKPIKASQNITWAAHSGSAPDAGKPTHIVRATPDADGRELSRVAVELEFLAYVRDAMPPGSVCGAILPDESSGAGDDADGEGATTWAVRVPSGVEVAADSAGATGDDLKPTSSSPGYITVAVFEYASGEPVGYTEYKWLRDPAIGAAWGVFLAQMHAASRAFSRDKPEAAAAMRPWDGIHEGILAGADEVCLSPDELAAWRDADPRTVGVTHGDLNASNFFLVDSRGAAVDDDAVANDGTVNLCVFDWDQASRGWYLYDVAVPTFSSHITARAGAPVTADIVDPCDERQFVSAVVRGYESVAGAGAVDAQSLRRMTLLRRQLYERFCALAAKQLAPEGTLLRPELEGMYIFMKGINTWVDAEAAAARARVMVCNPLQVTAEDGADGKSAKAPFDKMARRILAQRPDIVCLQGLDHAAAAALVTRDGGDSGDGSADDAANELRSVYIVHTSSGAGDAAVAAVLVKNASAGGRVTVGADAAVARVATNAGGAVSVPVAMSDGTSIRVACVHATGASGASGDSDSLQSFVAALAAAGAPTTDGDSASGTSDVFIAGSIGCDAAAGEACFAHEDWTSRGFRPVMAQRLYADATSDTTDESLFVGVPAQGFFVDDIAGEATSAAAGSGDHAHTWVAATLMRAPKGSGYPSRMSPWPPEMVSGVDAS